MKKVLSAWQIIGFVFTGIAGVLLHFLFEWTDRSVVVAPFSAVNESIFEHMKLLFFPMLVFALVENLYIGRAYISFWCIKLIGIISGIILIPVLYYTINGAFGTAPDWVNIAIYFVVAAFIYFVETLLFNRDIVACNLSRAALLILCLLAVAFMVLTFYPPQLPLFEDPIRNTYGYIK